VRRVVTLAPALSNRPRPRSRDRLVGVTRFDDDPRARDPAHRGYNDPQPEAVLASSPT